MYKQVLYSQSNQIKKIQNINKMKKYIKNI